MANMTMAKKSSRPIWSKGTMAFMMDLRTTWRPEETRTKETVRGVSRGGNNSNKHSLTWQVAAISLRLVCQKKKRRRMFSHHRQCIMVVILWKIFSYLYILLLHRNVRFKHHWRKMPLMFSKQYFHKGAVLMSEFLSRQMSVSQETTTIVRVEEVETRLLLQFTYSGFPRQVLGVSALGRPAVSSGQSLSPL